MIGQSVARVDIPGKVSGRASYVQDLRMPGLVHGRIVPRPAPGAALISVDRSGVESMPGVLKVVVDGSFLGVIAAGEFQAVEAMRALSRAARCYKNLAAFCAIALELEIAPETGRVSLRRVVAAVDCGEIVHPDGVRNQIEGGIIQSMSWTLYEAVTFDEQQVTSIDWSTYPVARFSSVPESMEVHLIPRPGMPVLGVGEASQGPAAAAIGNAIADVAKRNQPASEARATRLRDIPLTEGRIKSLLSEA